MSRSELNSLTQELRAKRDINPPTLADTRANFATYASRFPLDSDIHMEPCTVGDVSGELLTPSNADPSRRLLYFHGGGYIIGSPATHRALAGRLARELGGRAVVPDYRLAPEHPHPAASDDGFAVYRALLDDGVEPGKLIVAGDSAGGGLALATLLRARDGGLPLPAATVLLSPWVDMEATGASVAACADSDPVVAPHHIRSFARMFAGPENLRDPLAAPLHADLRDLPPTLIQVGTNETLLDDSRRLSDKLESAGSNATLRIWDDMFHVWQLFASELEEGRHAISEAGVFMRQHVAEQSVSPGP